MMSAATIITSLVLFVLAFLMDLLFVNEQFSRILGVCKDYI